MEDIILTFIEEILLLIFYFQFLFLAVIHHFIDERESIGHLLFLGLTQTVPKSLRITRLGK